jgi:large subunit ribosomal protein L25
MAEITVVAETGRQTGSRPANRLRTAGKVPGVVYGHGADAVTVTVEWRDLRQALTTDAGLNALIDLDIAGERQLTIVKSLQRDPVRRSVIHVDFLRISRDEEISVDVPIAIAGEAEAVTRDGGHVEQVLFALTITAKPGAIPNEIATDVSDLVVGATVRVGDLVLPAGVTTDVDADEPVVIAQSAAIEEPEVAEEGVEGEGEGAEPAAAADSDGGESAQASGGE